MKTSVYQDQYNTVKTWKIEQKNKAFYVSQFISGEQFGKTVKMTHAQIAEIGIFNFKLLSVIEAQKTKFTFITGRMQQAKTILAFNFEDAKRLAREYLNVKRLPNDYCLNRISRNIEYLFNVDIK